MYIITDDKNKVIAINDERIDGVENQYEFVGKLPNIESKPYMISARTYDGVFWGVIYNIDESAINKRIRKLKNMLSKTDYQPVKMWEAEKLGQEMPYDITKLEARKAWRDEINSLQQRIDENIESNDLDTQEQTQES